MERASMENPAPQKGLRLVKGSIDALSQKRASMGSYRPRCSCVTPDMNGANDGRCVRCWGWRS
jgi:hypothetical protein